jgi:sarcosine/dimethylglycine N-methyltransferase
MAKLAGKITPSTRVLDIGAGYGGSARFLAKKYECSVVCLNISEVENERNRILNTKQRLNHLIEVIDGTFDDVPFEDGSFDIVWSQDAILHSCDREKVLEEVARVLKPGGRFIFTDPMKNDECPDEVLQPILDRIQLDDLGCPRFYRKTARRFGLKEVAVEDHSEQIANHYGKVLQETESNADKLKGKVSKNYITRMKKGLKHWINGGRKGHLAWSIFVFQKKK